MITSAEEFYRLRTSEDPAEYGRAAHDSAPLRVWLEVIKRFPDLRVWVAQNKTVPVEILEVLSRDPDAAVRSFVAMKRKLPEALQLTLARDPNDGVRHRLVRNAKVTSKVLAVLATDPEPLVRDATIGQIQRVRSGAAPPG